MTPEMPTPLTDALAGSLNHVSWPESFDRMHAHARELERKLADANRTVRKANDNHEHFERQWYLSKDREEALREHNRVLRDILARARDAVDILRQVAPDDYHGNSPKVEEIDAALAQTPESVASEIAELRQWKKEHLRLTAWWQEIDDFVRSHPDSLVGESVVNNALLWLKARDSLGSEVTQLRKIVSDAMAAIGNGSSCSTEASLEFMVYLPTEIRMHIGKLRACTQDFTYGIRPDESIWISVGDLAKGPHAQCDTDLPEWALVRIGARKVSASPSTAHSTLPLPSAGEEHRNSSSPPASPASPAPGPSVPPP